MKASTIKGSGPSFGKGFGLRSLQQVLKPLNDEDEMSMPSVVRCSKYFLRPFVK